MCKSISAIQHIERINVNNHILSIHTRIALDKIQHSVIVRSQQITYRKNLSTIKAMYGKLTDKVTLNNKN